MVAPLAAISLLAAAAAVAINPVLVQVSFTGKRRKRSVTDDENNDNDQEWNPEVQEKMHELQVSFTRYKMSKNRLVVTFACTRFFFSWKQVMTEFTTKLVTILIHVVTRCT